MNWPTLLSALRAPLAASAVVLLSACTAECAAALALFIPAVALLAPRLRAGLRAGLSSVAGDVITGGAEALLLLLLLLLLGEKTECTIEFRALCADCVVLEAA